MRDVRGMSWKAEEPSGDDARGRWRVAIESSFLQCNLGEVLDCSLSGVRLRLRRPIRGDQVHVRLWDDEDCIFCDAIIVWRRRFGFFHHECGLLLAPLGPEASLVMLRLIQRHRNRLTFARDEVA